LVLVSMAFNHGSSHSPMADLGIQNVEAALPDQCIVRIKLFTTNNRLLQKRTGRLSIGDQQQVRAGLGQIMAL
jgi:hypothetical protein